MHKHLYENVHGNIIYSSEMLETTSIFNNGGNRLIVPLCAIICRYLKSCVKRIFIVHPINRYK